MLACLQKLVVTSSSVAARKDASASSLREQSLSINVTPFNTVANFLLGAASQATSVKRHGPTECRFSPSSPQPGEWMKFPRSRRIVSRGDFQRIRKKGKSFAGKFLVLGFLHDETLGEDIRLGLITTKQIGNAVTRNRVRRRLRGVAQRIGERIKPGHFLVLIARNRAADATSEQLEKEWKWMLHRNDLMLPKENTDLD